MGAVVDDEPQHALAAGAQCHAHADLLRPLRDGVLQDAVDSDRSSRLHIEDGNVGSDARICSRTASHVPGPSCGSRRSADCVETGVIGPHLALFIVPLESDMQRHVKDGRLRVYRSRDGGANWTPTEEGLPGQPHYVGVLRDSLAVDTLDPAGIYFGTSMGEVFYSRDAGESWSRLPGQFPRITSIKAWVRETDGEA